MRYVMVLMVLMVGVLLGGCLYNPAPRETALTMQVGETRTFTVGLFPTSSQVLWFMDEELVATDMTSYAWQPGDDERGPHQLSVQEINPLGLNLGPQYHRWQILVE